MPTRETLVACLELASRTVGSLFLVVLLTSALFVSIFTVATPPKEAHASTLTVTLSFPDGVYTSVIPFTATGASAATVDGTPCGITGAPSNVITQVYAQVYGGTVYGSFTVGNGPGNTDSTSYALTLTCGGDIGTFNFKVLPGVIFTSSSVNLAYGVAGQSVSVTGTGFASNAASCTLDSSTVVSAPSCSITLGSGTMTGGFTVAAVADATYNLQITPGKGASGFLTFYKVSTPNIGLFPTHAPRGFGTAGPSSRVKVYGAGFPTGSARSCTLSSTIAGFIFAGTDCTISSTGTVTAALVNFGVDQLSGAGAGNIQVADSTSVSTASNSFTVDGTPTVTLGTTSGSAGALVTVTSGGLFSLLDAGQCTISSSPGGLISSQFCVMSQTGVILYAVFRVSATAPNIQPGVYKVTVKGSHGDSSSPSTNSFTVTAAITITGNAYGSPPLAANPGSTITLSGTGFLATDTGCEIAPSAPTDISSSAATTSSCTLNPATGQITASFVVPSGAMFLLAGYQLGVLGDPAHDSAATPVVYPGAGAFMVVPRIILTPNSGLSGGVTVTGSGFSTGGGSCLAGFSSSPTGLFAASPAAVCTKVGGGAILASFTVDAAALNGPYTVKVQASGDAPDNGTAIFTKGTPLTLTISPFSGPTGTGPVSVTGTFAAGTFTAGPCTITAPLGSNLFAGAPSPTCTISAGGALTASFTVSTTAQGGTWAVQVTGGGGAFGTANFVVTPKMTLTPSSGESFALISIAGSGFSAADAGAGCASTLYSTPPGLLSAVSCSISAVTFQMTGTFAVAGGAAVGPYTVIFPSSLGQVSAPTFVKISSAFDLVPNFGPVGTVVSVSGSGFPTTDGTCTISSTPDIVDPASVSCSITGGTVSGFFTVKSGSVLGVSTVTVTSGPSGTSKNAPFQVNPGIVLSPSSGRPNTPVSVSGSNFAAADVGCSITSDPSGLISSPACVLVSGHVSGSFTVAAGTSGDYTVIVTGTSGDAGQAAFTVPPPPSLTLTPILGPGATPVVASGSDFAGSTCQLTSSPGGLFTSSSCSLAAGSLTAGSGFNVAPGAVVGTSYTVTVTTNLGAPDSATATFAVTSGPPGTLTLTPTSGPIGTIVSGSATGFTTDASCQLNAAPAVILSAASCTITGGGNANVGFTVAANTPSGSYTILAIGNTGHSATAPFTVTAGAQTTFVLSPTSGPVGTVVSVSGSSYAGTTCTLSATPSTLFSSSSCTISSGSLSGGFTVASGASLGYTVTVNTSAGESKTAPFLVGTGPGPTLNPTSGPSGTSITVSGSGYHGTTCTLTSAPPGLFSSSSCLLSSGTLTGSFTVAPGASGSYTVILTTDAGEVVTSPFSARFPPTFTLSETSGSPGTAVTASGSNYQGTTCALSSSPTGLLGSASCSITSGTLSGGFTVASGASVGSYTVTATTNAGETGSDNFIVATIPTLVLNPASGRTGAAVVVSGANYQGNTCTLAASGSLFSSSSCTISSGKLTGGFTVALTAPVGAYTLTATSNTGDSASATFSVTKPSTTCIIATATFGSEASPAVQFLRNFRDGLVLSTKAGSAFMEVFNAWYYSFSPTVASYITANDPLRAPIRVILYPLLGVLGISTATYSLFSGAPEFAVVMAGLVASSLIGLVYLTPFTLLGVRALIRRRKINVSRVAKGSLLLLAVALALLAVGEVAGSFLLLAVASSAIVLTCIIVVPTLVAFAVLGTRPK
jgi:hypothetical protein